MSLPSDALVLLDLRYGCDDPLYGDRLGTFVDHLRQAPTCSEKFQSKSEQMTLWPSG